jgi:hypothetical protein
MADTPSAASGFPVVSTSEVGVKRDDEETSTGTERKGLRLRRTNGRGRYGGPRASRGVVMTESEHSSAAANGSSTPYCLTVTEITAIYRISRCTAYAQAASYLRRGPGHGIPCVKIGNSVRFPAAWIEDHIGRRVDKSQLRSGESTTDRAGAIPGLDDEEGDQLDAEKADARASR